MRLVDRVTGWSYPLAAGPITLGRQPDSTIILHDPAASRQHARIQRSAGGYAIQDLGSSSGTFVNGQRIMAPQQLSPGDIIRMGSSELVVVRERSDSAPPRGGGGCTWVIGALVAVLLIALGIVLVVVLGRGSRPSVSLLTPAPGSLAQVGDQVYIQAEATDRRGVTRLELWVDEILVGVARATVPEGDRTLSARQGWTFTLTGTHTISAVAYNAAGRASETDRAPVEVVPFIVNPPTLVPSLTPPPPTSAPTFAPPTHAPSPTVVLPTSTPAPPPTATPTPTPSGPVEPVIEFWVEPRAIRQGETATLNWHIENVVAAYLDDEPVTGPRGERQVSPGETTIYTLRVLLTQGEELRLVTLVVVP